MTTKRAAMLAALMLSFCAAMPGLAQAQSYPSRPIRLIVPYGPGSGSDTVGRIVADQLSVRLGVPVVVDNREGAGGNIGAQLAAQAAPDGHTLVVVSNGFTIAPFLQATPPFDPVKDFTPVAMVVGNIAFAVVTAANSPIQSIADLVATARANPDKTFYGTSGFGSQSHFEAAQLLHSFGARAQHVHYKGVAPAMTGTMTGEVQFYIPGLGVSLTNIKGGKLRVLATGGRKRSPLTPDTPTLAEATGNPGYEAAAWIGIVAPAGTPPEIVAKLNAEIAKAVEALQARERAAPIGELAVGTPQQMGAQLREETAKWARLVKDLNIKPN